MEFSEIVAQLRRRWWLVLVGLFMTGALAYGTTFVVAVQYTAQSSLVLIPPRTTADTQVNPFLSIGGLNPAADVLVRALNTGAFHDQHAPAGSATSYTVARDTDASGPLLVVEVTDATSGGAMSLLTAVVEQAPVTLAQLQTEVGVQDSESIRITEVARMTQPKTDRKSQTRAILVASVVGLVTTVALVRIVDGLLIWRTRRSRPRSPAGEASPAALPEQHPNREDPIALTDAPDATVAGR
jgi:capsular polysaccharide biosynthesis protein